MITEKCKICKKETDIEELAEFQGYCWDCYKAESDRFFDKSQDNADRNCEL